MVSEVNILRELRHPNVVRYYDRVIDKDRAKLYIVMEYCAGGDLADVVVVELEVDHPLQLIKRPVVHNPVDQSN